MYARKGNCHMEFWRLEINGTKSVTSSQPMYYDETMLVCNGEVYNHLELGGTKGESDCSVIQPLIEKVGILETVQTINGDFAFVWSNGEKFYAARDRVGVRPLFYTELDSGMAFASEAKALLHFKTPIVHFPPAHIYDSELGQFICYDPMYYPYPVKTKNLPVITENIREKLCNAVKLRMDTSERPIGFFLSGGLDSSIIAAIGAMMSKKAIHTFSIGLEGQDSPDLIAARKMARHLGSKHTEVTFTVDEGIAALKDVIWHLETYDTTTVRASVPMFLLSKYIAEHTDIRVILSGEGADELFGGYLYFHKAPTTDKFLTETNRLVRDVNLFDVLRADRCTAAHGIELRVPFFDPDFIEYVMDGFSPEVKQPKDGVEKWILRKSFEDFLPEDILWRQKNGMSDAVGYSWVDGIKRYAESNFFWEKFFSNKSLTAEEHLYKYYYSEFFPDELVKYKWMPKWTVATDPSARYLDNFEDRVYEDEYIFKSRKFITTAGFVLWAAILAQVSRHVNGR
jgi:asparagine synthase (glutamine-hydrolysing)